MSEAETSIFCCEGRKVWVRGLRWGCWMRPQGGKRLTSEGKEMGGSEMSGSGVSVRQGAEARPSQHGRQD